MIFIVYMTCQNHKKPIAINVEFSIYLNRMNELDIIITLCLILLTKTIYHGLKKIRPFRYWLVSDLKDVGSVCSKLILKVRVAYCPF